MEYPYENRSTYFINPNLPSETARLVDLDNMLTEEMGGVFPPSIDPTPLRRVLDLACGPGGWVLKVADEFHFLDVVGVDISTDMIAYAQAQARIQSLGNASFQVCNILEPLPFPDESFDFVNARLLSSFVPKDAWEPLVQECVRITTPGGLIRLTEAEWIFTLSPAGEQIANLVTLAQWKGGKSFSPDGKRFAATLVLPYLLRDAGLSAIERAPYTLDFSYGEPAHETYYHNLMMGLPNMEEFLLKQAVTTKQEFEELCQRYGEEIQQETFRGLFFLRSAWGTKPKSS